MGRTETVCAEAERTLNCAQLRGELQRRVDRDIRGFEKWYREQKGERYLRAEEAAVLRALRLKPGSTLLDAGCGGGRFTILCAPRCRRVHAVDISPVAVEVTGARARERGLSNVTTAVADLTEGIPGEPVDRVIAVQALQHIPGAADRQKAVNHLRNALLPGGRLVVTTFNGGRWMDRWRRVPREATDPSQNWFYYYRFLYEELALVLLEAGLDRVEIRTALHLPGRFYRSFGAALLAPLDRALGWGPLGPALGIYLVGTGIRP